MKWLHLTWLLLLSAPASIATASTALLPAQSRATGGLILLDTKYESDDNRDYEAKGTMLFGGFKAPLNPRFAIGVGIGVLVDGTTTGDFKGKSGSGFRLGFDVDFDLTHFDKNELIATVGVVRDSLTYKDDYAKWELSQTDLALGLLVRHSVNKLSLYGGLQVFLLDKGTLKTSPHLLNSYDSDNSRQDKLNIRLGLAFAADPAVDLRLDLLLYSEQSIMLGADFKI